MSEQQDMKACVQGEFGAICSSELVDQKLRETYASLGEMPKRKKNSGITVLKWASTGVGAAAACFLVLLGIGFANPALAAQIPLVNNIISYFQSGSSQTYQSPMITQGSAEQYLQPVSQPAQNGFQVTGVYCDGISMILTTELTMPALDDTQRAINPSYSVTVADTQLEPGAPYETRMEPMKGEEKKFVGTIIMDVSQLELKDSFPVSVTLKEAVGVNTKLMVLAEEEIDGEKVSLGYQEKTTPLALSPTTITFDATLSDVKKEYAVNESASGCTLNTITVTPTLTKIQFTLENEEENQEDPLILFAYDDKGNELPGLYKFGDYTQQYFQALEPGVSAITVKFFHKSDKYNPAATFTVPVEGGYGKPYEELRPVDDGIPVVYDPPIPETQLVQNTREREGNRVMNLGETITFQGIPPVSQEEYTGDTHPPYSRYLYGGTLEVTYDNLRIYDSYTDAGVAEEDMNLSDWDRKALEEEKSKFILLDVTFDSTSAIPHTTFDEMDNGERMEEGGTYWISSFAYPSQVVFGANGNSEENAYWGTEVNYFSEHMNGITNYYHFTMEGTGTKTVQIGFVVPINALETDNFQLALENDDPIPETWEQNDQAFFTHPMIFINIPTKDLLKPE